MLLLKSDRVISKWGKGDLYEHSNFELPIQYGNTIRYYAILSKESALGYFVEFTKLHRIIFDEEPISVFCNLFIDKKSQVDTKANLYLKYSNMKSAYLAVGYDLSYQ